MCDFFTHVLCLILNTAKVAIQQGFQNFSQNFMEGLAIDQVLFRTCGKFIILHFKYLIVLLEQFVCY